MKKANLFLLLIVTILIFSSCAKDGMDGLDGVNGKDGTNGRDGAANATTTLFTIAPSQWVQHGNWYGVDLVVPSIKDSINDIVITNVSKVNTPYAYQWFGLPMSSIIVTGDIMNYVYGKGHETIGYNYYSAPTTDIIVKIQVITQSN